MAAMSKPLEYNQALGDYVCGQIAEGHSLRSILRREGLPTTSTWFRWLRLVEGLSEQYDRACEDRAMSYAEDIVDIADDSSGDTVEKVGRNGETYETLDTEFVARSKLRVDARKWVASRLVPKYRDKQDVNHSGGLVLHETNFMGRDPDAD